MKRIYRAALRDLYFNKARSLVVILALVMVIAFPVAMSNVAPNLDKIIEDEANQYQLAYYNFFFNNIVDKNVSSKLQNWAAESLDVNPNKILTEGRLHIDSKSRAVGNGNLEKNSWIDIDIISVEADNPPKINQLIIDEGHLPTTKNEIAVLSSLAKADGLKRGDTFTLYGPVGKVNYTIVGLVQAIEYASFDLSQTGSIYLSYEGIQQFMGIPIDGSRLNSFTMYFLFDISLEELRQTFEYIKLMALQDPTIEQPLVFTWFTRETSFRKSMQDALSLTSKYLLVASIFIFIVAGTIIFITMNRYVNEQKRVIGSMYAFGQTKWEVIKSFFLRIFILSLIAIILGLLLAKVFLVYLVSELVAQWGLITVKTQMSAISVIITLIGAFIIAYGFTFLALFNLTKLTPYEAMRGKTSELKNFGLIFTIAVILPTRTLRNAVKNLTRNRTRTLLTITAFMISITFAGSLLYTDYSISNTIDDYYDQRINYDLEISVGYNGFTNQSIMDDILNLDTNNNGVNDVVSYEPVIISFIPFLDEPEKLTFLFALAQDTKMMEMNDDLMSDGRWFRSNTSEIVVSRYVAGTLGLQINESFSFVFFNTIINTTVVGITNELMVSSTIFIDINYLSYAIQDVSKVPLVANKILVMLEEGLDPSDVQNVLNETFTTINITLTKEYYKSRFVSLADSQTAIIILLISLGLIVGFVSVLTTLLISIAERERELGLLHVFGNFNIETFNQILFEGLMLGALAVIPGITFGQLMSKSLWNVIISSSLFEIEFYTSKGIFLFLNGFTLVTIIISVIFSYMFTTSKELSEIIREE